MAATLLFMRDASLTLKIGAGPARLEVNCEVHTVELTVAPGDVVQYQTLCPDGSYSSAGKSSYALHIVAGQDWATDGLARTLWDHEGETAEFQLQAHGADLTAHPPSASEPGLSGVVTLVAPTYGGEVDTWAELDVELPCASKPTITTAAFPTVAEAETAPAETAAA